MPSLHEEIHEKVYSFKTKSNYGFVQSEIDELLKDYPSVNMNRFDDAMMGNTCMLSDDNEIINYFCDVRTALICGLEDRAMKSWEWD